MNPVFKKIESKLDFGFSLEDLNIPHPVKVGVEFHQISHSVFVANNHSVWSFHKNHSQFCIQYRKLFKDEEILTVNRGKSSYLKCTDLNTKEMEILEYSNEYGKIRYSYIRPEEAWYDFSFLEGGYQLQVIYDENFQGLSVAIYKEKAHLHQWDFWL